MENFAHHSSFMEGVSGTFHIFQYTLEHCFILHVLVHFGALWLMSGFDTFGYLPIYFSYFCTLWGAFDSFLNFYTYWSISLHFMQLCTFGLVMAISRISFGADVTFHSFLEQIGELFKFPYFYILWTFIHWSVLYHFMSTHWSILLQFNHFGKIYVSLQFEHLVHYYSQFHA